MIVKNYAYLMKTLVFSLFIVSAISCTNEGKEEDDLGFIVGGTPVVEDQLPWRDSGVWLMGDTHMHTTTSDGVHSVDDLASNAVKFGCDFIAITNHYKSEDPTAVKNAREKYPSLIVMQGTEWRIPCNRRPGYPEACIFVPIHADETNVIDYFNDNYDSYSLPPEVAIEGLEWLETQELNGVKPVAIINHPSKKGGAYTIDHLRDYDDAGTVCIGISGAPGHQKNVYDECIEGNDPMTAVIGDFTDQLLDEGREWWIRAPSDFHNISGRDYWPGDYSENHVFCEAKTSEGVCKGYRSGCMFYCHNDIITALDFTLESQGVYAMMGEILNLKGGNGVNVEIRVKYNQGVSMDQIEIISNASGEPASTKIFTSSDWKDIDGWLEMSCPVQFVKDGYVRIRGEASQPADKWFYSNPVRVNNVAAI